MIELKLEDLICKICESDKHYITITTDNKVIYTMCVMCNDVKYYDVDKYRSIEKVLLKDKLYR